MIARALACQFDLTFPRRQYSITEGYSGDQNQKPSISKAMCNVQSQRPKPHGQFDGFRGKHDISSWASMGLWVMRVLCRGRWDAVLAGLCLQFGKRLRSNYASEIIGA